MDIDFVDENEALENRKSKTSLRMRFEAEAKVLARQLGSLAEIQERIGVSGHKLCRMMLIDPSSWSRWKKQGYAPPYVYRSLQWFLLLEDKYPGLGPQTFLVDTGGTQAKALIQEEVQKREALEAKLAQKLRENEDAHQKELKRLQKHQERLENRLRILFICLGVAILALIALLFIQR